MKPIRFAFFGFSLQRIFRAVTKGFVFFSLIMATGASAAENILHIFGIPFDGSYPSAAMVADKDGNLFGTTASGGGTACGGGGCGTVFKLTPPASVDGSWTETVLYAFTGGSDGVTPAASLIADSNGNLYGTTTAGGGSSSCRGGCGIVFKLTPPASVDGRWTETVLYTFMGGSDGANPMAGLALDASGSLYGTTAHGGPGCAPNYAPQGCGTVFKLDPPISGTGNWTETVLFGFHASDGWYPAGGVTLDASGALYGTTQAGGSSNVGTVFKLAPPASADGSLTHTTLYNFTGYQAGLPSSNPDGAGPASGLIFDTSGALYGTTIIGGTTGLGTVFKLASSGGNWNETVLYTFTGGSSDGANPVASLLLDTKGVLYGTTNNGGSSVCASGCGTVFKVAYSGGNWNETVLYTFTGGSSDGAKPVASLIADSKGNLYGTTSSGTNSGTAFQLTGTGFAAPLTFAGVPGAANCFGKSTSVLVRQYGGLNTAAWALGFGFSNVDALQSAIRAYCG